MYAMTYCNTHWLVFFVFVLFLFAVNSFELHEQNSWIVPRLSNSVIVTKAIDGDEGEENPVFYFS